MMFRRMITLLSRQRHCQSFIISYHGCGTCQLSSSTWSSHTPSNTGQLEAPAKFPTTNVTMETLFCYNLHSLLFGFSQPSIWILRKI
jgi:hypothetical protein